jgi:hypothetical protein
LRERDRCNKRTLLEHSIYIHNEGQGKYSTESKMSHNRALARLKRF